MNCEKLSYQGWPNCYRLSNGIVDLIVTTDVGPRVMRYGFVGQANEFYEVPEMLGQTGGEDWRVYGGHRLWHAPEDPYRTYRPDNSPVQIELLADGMRLTQPVEEGTGIQKQIEMHLAADATRVQVSHRLVNKNATAVTLAPWALSVMAPGGVGILPLPPRGPHPTNLVPASTLALWAYTDFTDPRWILGQRFVLLRQMNMELPQKIGAWIPDGWLGYARNEHFFLTTFTPQPGATYPDLNSCGEFFTNADMLEVETLGPLTTLAPNASVDHHETWELFRDFITPQSEAEFIALLPRLGKA
jgi:hypothetical protein